MAGGIKLEKNIQLFVTVNKQGEIVNAQMGLNIIVTDPSFPFVFMIDEDTAARISEDISKFRVEVENFETRLIET